MFDKLRAFLHREYRLAVYSRYCSLTNFTGKSRKDVFRQAEAVKPQISWTLYKTGRFGKPEREIEKMIPTPKNKLGDRKDDTRP